MGARGAGLGRRGAAVAAAVALTTAGWSTTAGGQPPEAEEPANTATGGDQRAAAAASGGGSPTTLTLISGHQVQVEGERVTLVAAPDSDLAPVVQRRTPTGTLVIPADLLPLVPERLDPRLFDVQLLAASAARGEQTPLIVELAEPAGTGSGDYAEAADSVTTSTGLEVDADLESIGAFSTRVSAADVNDAESLDSLLASLEDTPQESGVEKVWLSAPVTANDEDSNPQIGAPEAWERGLTGEGVRVAVLDTGIDTGHPDLADNVVAEQDFSGSPDPGDRSGHGTHVAGIVAGTGAGAPERPGVAYDADLLNGKVFDDEGYSDEAIIIEAMEWAVEQDAAVVNMSLGGGPSDGTDPVAEAVNSLTEDSGTLFVVSAGNEGWLGDYSVSTPATADLALAVANVDKQDVLAEDSSLGPRIGDSALKPDIAAPGVDIIAARAEGTDGMNPIDDLYTANSGTSMSAPHVAGAAAILLQDDPGLGAPELKARLMGSSDGVGHTVWQEGAGRVDIPAALDAQVYAETPSLSFGAVAYPPTEQDPVTLPVTFRNTGEAAVDLTLAAEASGPDGAPAPEGMVTVSSTELTVPAGGTASVEATLTPAAAGEATGLYGGVITASSPDGATTRVPLGADLAHLTYPLTIEGVNAEGEPADGDFVDVINMDDGTIYTDFESFEDGVLTVDVPPGNYAVFAGFLSTQDWVVIAEPDVLVEGDTTVGIDARTAEQFQVETHRPSQSQIVSFELAFVSAGEEASASFGWGGFDGDITLATNPTGESVAAGEFAATFTDMRTAAGAGVASLVPRLPYGYHVFESTSGMPTETEIVADQDSVATVRTFDHSMSDAESTPQLIGWFAHPEDTIGGGGGWLIASEAPGQRLDYLTGDLAWSRGTELILEEGEDPLFAGDLTSPPILLGAGEQVTLPWGAQVFRPGLARAEVPEWASVTRVGDLLIAALPLLVDGSGNASYYSEATSAAFEVWADGELVAEDEYPFAEIEVPTGPADYRMVLDVQREAEWWQRSTAAQTEWTITSENLGEEVTVLPLLEVSIQPQRLDAGNRVTRTVDLDVGIEHQFGAETDAVPTGATLEWSSGDGAWQPAELEEQSESLYTTRLDLPAGTEAVDLRVSAEDSDGATVTTEVERALVIEASVSRTAGADRYETAAAVAALHGFSDVVYLASGEQFPDALSVGGVAGALEAPVLLTQPDNLPGVTETALLDSGAREVVVLGGEDAVGPEVVAALEDQGYEVTRVGGADRYGTAALLADGVEPGGTVVVASGEVYADALAGGPVASQDGRPVLLVKEGHVPAATASALAALDPAEIVLLGGADRVDESVAEALGQVAPVTRVAGADRYATAGLVGELLGEVPPEGTGSAYLASGADWPDALTLAARAGAEGDPVLLAKPDALPSATGAALVDLDRRRVIAAGESEAISDTVLEVVAALLDD